jgi:hypothetical protein
MEVKKDTIKHKTYRLLISKMFNQLIRRSYFMLLVAGCLIGCRKDVPLQSTHASVIAARTIHQVFSPKPKISYPAPVNFNSTNYEVKTFSIVLNGDTNKVIYIKLFCKYNVASWAFLDRLITATSKGNISFTFYQTYPYSRALNQDEEIEPEFTTASTHYLFSCPDGFAGINCDNLYSTPKYMGFRINSKNGYQLGWLKVTVDRSNDLIILHEYAYTIDPNVPLNAGEI